MTRQKGTGSTDRAALPREQPPQRRLKADFARIERDQKAATTDLADLVQRTRDALKLLVDAHQTYQRATAGIRRQLDHALFARVDSGFEPTTIRVAFNQPYDTLTAPQDGAK